MNQPLPPVPYSEADFDYEDSNRSGNPHFSDLLRRQLNRRQLLGGGLGLAVSTGVFAHSSIATAVGRAVGSNASPARAVSAPLSFTAVPVGRADDIVVPAEYAFQVLLPWGTPITGNYPAYVDGGLNTGAEQEQQIGMNHDGMHFFPLSTQQADANSHGLLVMNHEYIDPNALHPNGPTSSNGVRDADQVRKEIAGHGVSIAEVRKQSGVWGPVTSTYNRRITGATPMTVSGPARGHAKLQTAYSADGTRTRGTFNNCSMGYTPWGTYLTCEENWAGYFVNRGERPREQVRYGVPTAASRYGWETVEPRFNATPSAADASADYRNEPNLFGWIVEIDPFDPNSTPIKRTAMGRCGHEGVVFAQPRPGKPVVAYMGDDSQNEYIYKFVSKLPYLTGSATNRNLLDQGTLYVAKFNDDGRGDWLPLDIRDPAFRAAAAAAGVSFTDQADVLINTRLAADAVGATRMDRPEWGAVDPTTGMVYFTLSNNAARSAGNVDESNPRGPNPYGHIIRFLDGQTRLDERRFTWDIFLLAGTAADSLDPNGSALSADNILASPDGLWFDSSGLLWVQTDMGGSQLASGPFGNNMMLVANPATGQMKRFLVGPVGCEITGVVTTPDRRTLFLNIQHPGEDGNSTWPDRGIKPRPATVVVTRSDGGIVGS
ncbi:MAG: PhoX family protein [Luteimonas sp.]